MSRGQGGRVTRLARHGFIHRRCEGTNMDLDGKVTAKTIGPFRGNRVALEP